jgi:hypothetical protein
MTFVLNVMKEEFLGGTTRLLSLDNTQTAQEMTRPTVLLLLRVYSLPREYVYRAFALKQ